MRAALTFHAFGRRSASSCRSRGLLLLHSAGADAAKERHRSPLSVSLDCCGPPRYLSLLPLMLIHASSTSIEAGPRVAAEPAVHRRLPVRGSPCTRSPLTRALQMLQCSACFCSQRVPLFHERFSVEPRQSKELLVASLTGLEVAGTAMLRVPLAISFRRVVLRVSSLLLDSRIRRPRSRVFRRRECPSSTVSIERIVNVEAVCWSFGSKARSTSRFPVQDDTILHRNREVDLRIKEVSWK